MPLTQAAANALANASMGGTAFSMTTPAKVALCTTAPTATAPGTEVAGGSYARQAITALTAATGSTPGSNANALTYTNMPAVTAPAIGWVDVYDSAGSPAREWYGGLTASKTTNAGDTFTIAAGALTYQLT